MPKKKPAPKRTASTTGAPGDVDLHLFNEGTHTRLHDVLGGHLGTEDGTAGARFSVWAPGADRIEVAGDFNGWDGGSTLLEPMGPSGVWTGFVPGAGKGDTYKFRIRNGESGEWREKLDPVAGHTETPPATASKLWDYEYAWGDDEWMAGRGPRQRHDAPISIYEVHLGSWKRHYGGTPYTYDDLIDPLIEHVSGLGFTHVELLPVMEHPFYGSWGYQTLGYFAPTSRYGEPQAFMRLVDRLHQAGIGVILDWVPSHFPTDDHGLARFDGSHLYEHADPREGFHQDWKSLIFNYGRHEVRSFLLSSALCWLDRYHVDGLRVDAVASMLYRDYSREEGEWIPNVHGGNENLEAIAFLRDLNTAVFREFPDAQTFAEESTAWPGVSRPVEHGGLGFGFKWDMGWMHDTLSYLQKDPVHRKHHHGELTFRALYQFSENYCLPLSHDEVVHGKGSLLAKMPGDDWQRFANLRLLLGLQFTSPGKKLLFMGDEFGQPGEWNHETELDWSRLAYTEHQGVQRWVSDLARLYRDVPALHALDCDWRGWAWVDAADYEASVVSFRRRASDDPTDPEVVVVFNGTPVVREGYRLGVPYAGHWEEVANSDATEYGGSGVGNLGGVDSDAMPMHGLPASIEVTLPPLGMLVLRGQRRPAAM